MTLANLLRGYGTAPTTPEGWAQLARGLRRLADKSWPDSIAYARVAGRELGRLVGLEGREGGWVYGRSGRPIMQGWWQTLSWLGLRLGHAGRDARWTWTPDSAAQLIRWACDAEDHLLETTTPERTTA